VLELSWFAAKSDVYLIHTQADRSFWMDLGFLILDKGIDTYLQHYEKVPIHAGKVDLINLYNIRN
jgi:hypothetical protein